MPLVRCMQIYASLMMYNPNCILSSASIVVYKPFVGLIRVVRFDLMGNAKAFESWNERQELAPRPFFVWDETNNNIPLLESCGTIIKEWYAHHQIYVFWS